MLGYQYCATNNRINLRIKLPGIKLDRQTSNWTDTPVPRRINPLTATP